MACGGAMRDIPYADAVYELPLAKSMTDPGNFRAARMLRAMMARESYDLVTTHTSLASFFTRWAVRGMKHRPPHRQRHARLPVRRPHHRAEKAAAPRGGKAHRPPPPTCC